MILLVDAGNTRIKWAAVEHGAWLEQGVLASGAAAGLAGVLARFEPAWVGVCCVAGTEVRTDIEALLTDRPNHWLVPARQAHGIVNRYDLPETLGADRYAILVACRRRGLAPCVAVSVGTAATVDALTGDGEFLGGMILPGIALAHRALAGGTAAVPELPGEWCEFPRNTGDAVATGVLTALTGAVESMRDRLSARLGGRVHVVLTGGDAGLLAGHLAGGATMEANLVLEGLLWLARDLGVSGA